MVGPRLRSTGPALFSKERFTSLDQVRAVLRRYRDAWGLRNIKQYRGESRRVRQWRSEEHTSELQSLMRNSYAVFCLKKKKQSKTKEHTHKTNTQKPIKKITRNTIPHNMTKQENKVRNI